MKTNLRLVGMLAAAMLLFVGCGGGSSSDNGSGGNGTASSSASSVSSSSSVGSSSSVAGTVPKALAAAQAMIVGGFAESMLNATNAGGVAGAPSRSAARTDVSSYVCPNGGSADITGTTLTFSNCQSEGITLNGSMTSDASGTTTFSEFSSDDGSSYTYIDATMSTNGTASSTAYDISINGTFEHTENGETERIVFTNYHATRNGDSFTVDGTVSIQNDPDVCDANGDYVIQTVVPLTINASGYVSGTIKVNGDTIVYNGDGTATINGETYELDGLDSCSA